jgi:tetratricopeptide (TPR) repeat protein
VKLSWSRRVHPEVISGGPVGLRFFAGVLISLSVLLFSSLFLFSCSQSDPGMVFPGKLEKIDTLISVGDSVAALKQLASLRKNAHNATQWLSIAKRERHLGAGEAAVKTLLDASKAYPTNTMILAVLADTEITLGRSDDALTHTATLAGTPYSPLAVCAAVIKGRSGFVPGMDVNAWSEAWVLTKEPVYLRDAAVISAASGGFSRAASIAVSWRDAIAANASGDDNANLQPANSLCARLSYDARLYDRVALYFSRNATDLELADISLLADAAWLGNDTAAARVLWRALLDRDPKNSPIPWYNLAATASSFVEEKALLRDSLALFPAYVPAVTRYVRKVPFGMKKEARDPVTDELEKAGFESLGMETEKQAHPVTAESAQRALDDAISASGDIRLKIEAIRFTGKKTPDTVRTTAALWKLLEKNPDDTLLVSWACWYFVSVGDYDACFSLNGKDSARAMPFYSALAEAMAGDLDAAEKDFSIVKDNAADGWRALANIARIREKQGDLPPALEYFTAATKMANDDRTRSALQYEVALILIKLRYPDRAGKALEYAISLDSSNYRAVTQLRKLDDGSVDKDDSAQTTGE